MSQIQKNEISITNSKYNKGDITDMTFDNSEDIKNIKAHSMKVNLKQNNIPHDRHQINENDNDESFLTYKLKRSNSIKLYKMNKLEKKKHENNNNNLNLTDDKSSANIQNEKDFINNNDNNAHEIIKKNQKKVSFKEPGFVEIIDVESYKKYNEENTSKDPYEYLYNNDNKINEEKKRDGKERTICSCLIL